jgi:carboxyl-terminal processing protease
MHRPLSLLALLAGISLCGVAPKARAETNFNIVGREMVSMLHTFHYGKIRFDAALSERILENFLEDLDPVRIFFTEEDVVRLRRQYGRRLHDLLLRSRGMEPASEIYKLFADRVAERDEFVRALLEEPVFAFDSDQSILASRAKAERPADQNAARELWRRHLENDLLTEALRRELAARYAEEQADTVTKSELGIEAKILLSYERFRRNVAAANEEDIASYFYSAVATTHDPHTDYMSTSDNERFQARMRRGLVGIGVTLQG